VLPTKIILPIAALVAMLGASGTPLVGTRYAAAQSAATAPQTPAPGAQSRPNRPPRPPHEFGRHLEGRIAFLKAELTITPDQEVQWNKVAQAMRENVQQDRSVFGQLRDNRGQPRSAVSRIETRAHFESVRAQNTEHFLAAFRPLYASLSADQKKAADDLFMPRHGHHFGRH
jgi:periplasmic protein CpxP/Spy